MSEPGQAVRAATDSYDLPETLTAAHVSELPAGSNLLIAGPTMTNKEEMALRLSSHGYRQPAIFVSTDTSAGKLHDRIDWPTDDDAPRMYVVDSTGSDAPTDKNVHVERVSSPGDLTGIGVGVAKCMREIGEDAEGGLRLAHISLSTLLQYTSPERVFRFAHVLGGRISAAGYLGIWTLNTDSHDPQTVNTLKGQFEYVAEIRENDDGSRELRVLGGKEEWRQWTPI